MASLCAALCLLTGVAGCGTTLSPQAAVLPPTELSGTWYRAGSTDDLNELARRHGVPVLDIEEINGLDRSTPPPPGQLLFIPKAEARRRAERKRAAAGSSSVKTKERAGRALAWPLGEEGKIASPFGRRRGGAHEGIDIAAPEGTPVLAADAGKVIYSGAGIRGYGNLIIVRHRGDLVTVYAHNRRNLVQRGATVKRGERIAELGHTGRASGDHLHFEVRNRETPVDPLHYFVGRAARSPRSE